MDNYFNYYTEIEQHFCRRRGTLLTVSTLDWALMTTWKEAGIPLEAVLRGIDEAFDKYERRPSKTQKINGLAWCAQAVLTAAEEMKEAAVGAQPEKPTADPGLQHEEIARYFAGNAEKLRQVTIRHCGNFGGGRVCCYTNGLSRQPWQQQRFYDWRTWKGGSL